MKINLKKTLVVTLIAAIAVNATVITSMESDKRKEILATDVESQAGPVDPGSQITQIVCETILKMVNRRTGPLSDRHYETCKPTEFSAYLVSEGVSKNNVDAYLKETYGKTDCNAKYILDYQSNKTLNASLVNQYFPMEQHVTRDCMCENGNTCTAVNQQPCKDQFKSYMKTLKKFK